MCMRYAWYPGNRSLTSQLCSGVGRIAAHSEIRTDFARAEMNESDHQVNHEAESASRRRRHKNRSERANKTLASRVVSVDEELYSPNQSSIAAPDEDEQNDTDRMLREMAKYAKSPEKSDEGWDSKLRRSSLDQLDAPHSKGKVRTTSDELKADDGEVESNSGDDRQLETPVRLTEKVLPDFPEVCSRIRQASSATVTVGVLGAPVNVAKQQLTNCRFGMTHCSQAQFIVDQIGATIKLVKEHDVLETWQSCDDHLRAFRELVRDMQQSASRLVDEVARANSYMHILLSLAQANPATGGDGSDTASVDGSLLNETLDSSAFELIVNLIDELGVSHDVRELLEQLGSARAGDVARICSSVCAHLVDSSLLKRLSQLNETFRMLQSKFRTLFARFSAEPQRKYSLASGRLLSATWQGSAMLRTFVAQHDALCTQAVFWIERLLCLTVQLLGFGTPSTIGDNDLWQINRGIEDALTLLRLHKPFRPMTSYAQRRRYHARNDTQSRRESARTFDFSAVLDMIAHERAKRFARATLCTVLNDYRLALALKRELTTRSVRKQPDVDSVAPSIAGSAAANVHLPSSTVTANCSVYDDAVNNLDWFGMLAQLIGSQKAKRSKLTHRNIFIEPVTGFDMQSLCDSRKNQSLLQDLLAEEQQFVDRLLTNALQSTSLVNRKGRIARGTQAARRKSALANGELPVAPRAKPSGQFLFGAQQETRKTVNWSDAVDSSLRSQFVSRYFDALWAHMGSLWYSMVAERTWGQRCGNTRSLGSVHSLHPLGCISVVKCYLFLAECDPLFAGPALGSCVLRLQCELAHSLWHSAMCSALACRRTDILQRRATHSLSLSTMTMHHDDIEQCGAAVRHLWNATVIQLCNAVDVFGRIEPKLHVTHDVQSLLRRVTNGGYTFVNWLATDGHRDVQASDLSAFLRLLCSDYKLMNYIVALSQRVLKNSAASCCKDGAQAPPLAVTLNKFAARLESCVSAQRSWQQVCLQQMTDRFKLTTAELLSHNMPCNRNKNAQVWRIAAAVSESADAPPSSSEYVEELVQYLVADTISSLFSFRAVESRQTVITMLVNAVCDSWMQFILDDRIKFSVAGAALLERHLNLFLYKTEQSMRSHYPSTSQSQEADEQLAKLVDALSNAESVGRFRARIHLLAAEKATPDAVTTPSDRQRSAKSVFVCSCGSVVEPKPPGAPFGSTPSSGREPRATSSLSASGNLGSTSSLNHNGAQLEKPHAAANGNATGSLHTDVENVKWERLRADHPDWKLLPFCS